VYLRTGGVDVALAEATKDSDVALDPRRLADDPKIETAEVAGPAALLVAKLHKIAERVDIPTRLNDKDAHDSYRLLRAIDTESLRSRVHIVE